jgi:mannosyltransferase OCH1-like enzyme
MIPKVIHYCWFGGNPQTALMTKCRRSWKRKLSCYQIKRWDESNAPMRFAYMQTAARNRKWANMSNFIRLYALYAEGGIYLDTDVEVLKSFDDLLHGPAFLGCETKDPRINNAVFGAERGHPLLLRMMSALVCSFSGLEPANESSPDLTTRMLRDLGLKTYAEQPQRVGDVFVYPTRFFYPYFYGERFRPGCITADTYAIHHWEKKWD